jgi:hypothetical protein
VLSDHDSGYSDARRVAADIEEEKEKGANHGAAVAVSGR